MQKYVLVLSVVLAVGTQSFAAGKQRGSVVKDERNGIYWQDTQSSKMSSEDWDDAVLYCDHLYLRGMSHWRLPTFEELLSIVDYRRAYPAINPLFDSVTEGTYWTSTTFSPTTSRAWTIDFRTGTTYYSYKTTNHAVRCVKEIADSKPKESK